MHCTGIVAYIEASWKLVTDAGITEVQQICFLLCTHAQSISYFLHEQVNKINMHDSFSLKNVQALMQIRIEILSCTADKQICMCHRLKPDHVNHNHHLKTYVQQSSLHNVTVTVQWEFDGGVPVDNYTTNGTNTMTATLQPYTYSAIQY